MTVMSKAIEDLRNGKMVILVDDENRENEGDLVIAAEYANSESINFMLKNARGLLCLSFTEADVKRLQLPFMMPVNKNELSAAFTVSIGARRGMTTGVSAADRAYTIKVAIDSASTSDDISSPGHVFPLCARPGGIFVRGGQTEGSVDLCKIAGLKPAAVICEIMKDDGTMARMPDLREFAKKYNLAIVTTDDILTHRTIHENVVEEVASAPLPVKHHGNFTIKVFRNIYDGSEHIALIREPLNYSKPVLVRIHSECLTGDTFGSERCDCGAQWEAAINAVAREGGVLFYMRQEGRGIGITNKIKAYALQDQGLDTVEANHRLGFQVDHRRYGMCAQMLKALNISQVRLMTNNPKKIEELKKYGVNYVERVPLEIKSNPFNERYLKTKASKMGHLLNDLN